MNKFATLATFAFILLGKSIVRGFDLMEIKVDFELNTIGTFQWINRDFTIGIVASIRLDLAIECKL